MGFLSGLSEVLSEHKSSWTAESYIVRIHPRSGQRGWETKETLPWKKKLLLSVQEAEKIILLMLGDNLEKLHIAEEAQI